MKSSGFTPDHAATDPVGKTGRKATVTSGSVAVGAERIELSTNGLRVRSVCAAIPHDRQSPTGRITGLGVAPFRTRADLVEAIRAEMARGRAIRATARAMLARTASLVRL